MIANINFSFLPLVTTPLRSKSSGKDNWRVASIGPRDPEQLPPPSESKLQKFKKHAVSADSAECSKVGRYENAYFSRR